MPLKLVSFLVLLLNLSFVAASTAQPVIIEVTSVEASHDTRTGKPIIKLTLAGSMSAKEQMDLTGANAGKKAALRANGNVIASPVIREPIAGSIQITDNDWTEEKVKSLVDQLTQTGAKVELVIPSAE
jgi:preprotein translocase subunit SecD